MWVAQITEPADGESTHPFDQIKELQDRFPQYRFSVLMGQRPFIICKPVEETVMMPGDEGQEREILQFIIGALIDELINE